MRQNFVAQFIQLLKCWLYDMWSAVVVEKNWALYVFQCWLEVFQFSQHLINLLSILRMISGGFKKQQWIRPAADGQMVTMTFSGVSLALGSALELLLSPTITSCHIQSTFHYTLQSN